jgi:hypothetical protein
MRIYGEITKIEAQDDGTIRVEGVASSGAVDDVDETVLPEAMKAALPGYMRFGALREMHGLSAAGATLKAEVGEDGVTRIQAHVVDPVAVKKVQLGVYKGFSIGGRVLARDPADRNIITKLRLKHFQFSGFWFAMEAGRYTQVEFDPAGAETEAEKLFAEFSTQPIWADCQRAWADAQAWQAGQPMSFTPGPAFAGITPATVLYYNPAICAAPAWATPGKQDAVIFQHTFFHA